MKSRKLLLLAAVVVAVVAFFYFDLGQLLSFEFLKSQQTALTGQFAEHPWRTVLAYFLIYVSVTALSLPGALIMSLAGGAIFGLLWGTVLVSFASSMGATLAFLASRFLFRDAVTRQFGHRLDAVNEGMEKDGAFYLFTLRLVPIVPFFALNLIMGLTPIRTRIYYLVSQLGMLPATLVYLNAGTQLAGLDSAGGILSARVIISFALLGIFPLIMKKFLDYIRARKVYSGHQKPKKFDRNVIVIGAGSAGLVTAYIAAQVRARVTLVEKNKMGGDCLNRGCVPSKALLRSARFLAEARHSGKLGIRDVRLEFDFADVMERIQRVIKTIEPHDSVERYQSLGVECIAGEAKLTSPWTIEVNGQPLSARSIVIATGSRPFIPPIEGIDQVQPLTSDTVWNLRTRPTRLLVLGGGPIGSELTQAFSRLDCKVTQVEMADRLLNREDEEFSDAVKRQFIDEGIDVRTGYRAFRFGVRDGNRYVVCLHQDEEHVFEFDQVLVAVGRIPNVEGFGLEQLDIQISGRKTIEVDGFLRTNYPNIFACGDVAGPYQFTHVGAHQAWYASVNALFGQFKKFKVDYSVIPWATFTDPEVARVGINELEARERNITYEVTRYGIDDLDRAIADESAFGEIKVLTTPGKDEVLGVTIMGSHAGELIHEFVLAMKHGLGLNKILGTIHIYPTFSESNKYAAGQWRKAHKPEKVLDWLERYHAWRRG